jgi:hypothetical protein
MPITAVPVTRPRAAFETTVIVSCTLWPSALALRTVNVGPEGLCLVCHDPPPVGTAVVVRMRSLSGWIDLPAEVANIGSIGFDLRFAELDDRQLDAVDALLDQAENSAPIFAAAASDGTAVDPKAIEAEWTRIRASVAQRRKRRQSAPSLRG